MRLFSVLTVVLLVASSAFGQLVDYYGRDKEIENKLERLLAQRDVGELANELALKKSAGTEDLLLKLSVFARAGHRVRLHDTLLEVAKTYPAAPNREQILRVVKRALDAEDLAAQRLFYERFATEGDNQAGAFIGAWQQKGNPDELEKWLAARAEKSETWWWLLVDLKKSRRTAQPIVDALAQQIRQNPSDYALVKKYLRVLEMRIYASIMEISPIRSYENYEQDVAWLAETVKTDSPYEIFDLGVRLQNNHPLAAARLFEKSLSLAYGEKDARLVGEYLSRHSFFAKQTKNPEKAFRGWTKLALVQLYRNAKQEHLAQPLVESLTADGVENIESYGNFAVAGAVQSATTARVVENRVLMSEKLNENSPDYWLNRAAYYQGRQDTAEVQKTFRLALEKFPYQPNDWQATYPRMKIIYFLGWKNDEDPEFLALLRGEFVKAQEHDDARYLYELWDFLNESFEDVYDEFFTNTNLLPKILAAKPHWIYDDGEATGRIPFMIENAMKSEKWDAKKREAVWRELVRLARRDLPARGYSLIQSLLEHNENQKAIALLEESLKIAPVENKLEVRFDRETLSRELFDAYLEVGDLRKAEKMVVDGFGISGNERGRIAVAAAQSGKIADASRLWKTYANFDRRQLGELYELAKTEAKTPLREFYAQMKAADALSDVPDKALAILR